MHKFLKAPPTKERCPGVLLAEAPLPKPNRFAGSKTAGATPPPFSDTWPSERSTAAARAGFSDTPGGPVPLPPKTAPSGSVLSGGKVHGPKHSRADRAATWKAAS